ncbi:MAG: Gfo/Idh/MocA family protein [Algoriphagus aquaeductus]|uniref:Gfo/Idh/MocA family protein n=1 Tax=Algoriphagus aquaeductus TaxID=475299 RepID=UPI00391BDA96
MKSSRRSFIKKTTAFGAAASLSSLPFSLLGNTRVNPIKIGIIGLDTSHAPAFTKLFNAENPKPELAGFRVVAAYPYGSRDIKSSMDRIPGYIDQVKEQGVEIVDSIEALLQKVDVVLLETNDGKPHLEQARAVFKAKKPVFIDKPVAGSFADAVKIYQEAEAAGVSMFSCSSLRYQKNVYAVRHENKVGKVLACDAFSPATLEPSHPDLFWYGIHGVEILFTAMGPGCESVTRFSTPDAEVVVGTWKDGRIGTFRGMRSGKHDYGGTAFGTEGNLFFGPFEGYEPLVVQIAEFFRTKKSPIDSRETLEIYAFMEAADESKRRGGDSVRLDTILKN